MVTSSNGNIFHVTGPVGGGGGIHRLPVNSHHKGQWRRAWMFSLICALNKPLSKQSRGWWFETTLRSLWRHCNVIEIGEIQEMQRSLHHLKGQLTELYEAYVSLDSMLSNHFWNSFRLPFISLNDSLKSSKCSGNGSSPQLSITLQSRHNERDGVSNHQRLDCLLDHFFRCRLKQTSKLCVTGLCEVTGDFPAQRARHAENVSIWWRHHDISVYW